MDSKEFNILCARYMGWPIVEKDSEIGTSIDRNPYDDMNQLAEVFDKAISNEREKLHAPLLYESTEIFLSGKPINQALRDFITQALER